MTRAAVAVVFPPGGVCAVVATTVLIHGSSGKQEEFSLPEQRHRLAVMHGGISRRHVVHYATFPTGRWPGRWTRKAADRRALCGSLSACAVGIDAADWPTEQQPVPDASDVDCKRCRERYARLFPPGREQA